jgi:hypothetical protein
MPKLRPIPLSRALPSNVTALESQRVVKRTYTLLDETEQALKALFDEPKFRRLRDALEPEETVEGSIFADDIVAAQMIRKVASELNLHQVEEADLTLLAQKLRGAERRFNAARSQRAKAADEPVVTPAPAAAQG